MVSIMSNDVLVKTDTVTQAPVKPPIAEMEVSSEKYIKPSLIRYPVYQYETGKQMFLSKKERIVADAYIRTGSVAEARRVINDLLAKHGSHKAHCLEAIRNWLQKPHVAQFIAGKWLDEGRVNWFDKPKWEAWGVDIMQGKNRVHQTQVAVWERYGKAKGWFVEQGSGGATFNQVIQIRQADGSI